jgi:predicted  nucleic acid-binding Zn-ribbon protein
MATTRSNRGTEAKYEALQNELEMLKDELDSNQLQQEELRGLERGLQERIEVLTEQLEERSYSDDDGQDNEQ